MFVSESQKDAQTGQVNYDHEQELTVGEGMGADVGEPVDSTELAALIHAS